MAQETMGKVKQLKGRAKEAVGILIGDRELESEGAIDRKAGAVQETLGKARRQVGDALHGIAKSIKK